MKSSVQNEELVFRDSSLITGDCKNTVDIIPPSYNQYSWMNPQWQSVTADQGGFLCGFKPQIGASNSFDGGYFRIFEGQGTSGNLVFEKVIAAMSSAVYIDVPDDSILLIQGNEYTFQLEDTVSYFGWGRVYNVYPGGVSRYSETQNNPLWDLAFALDIKPLNYLGDFNQSLSVTGTELSISKGNTVDLANINTDNQTLSLNGTSLSISGGNSADLSSLDSDDQTLSLNGTNLTISGGNTTNLSSLNTDNQTLSLSGNTLSISGGNSADLTSLQDNLGDHTATTNIELNGNWISNDGGNEGISILNDGKVGIGTDNPQAELDLRGFLSINDLNPGIEFIESQFGVTRRSLIINTLVTSPSAADENQMEFWVSNAVGQNMAQVMELTGDQTTKLLGDLRVQADASVQGDASIKGNTSIQGDTDVTGDLSVTGNVSMRKNIVYAENWGTGINLNHDVWYALSDYTGWMDVESGNLLKADYNLSVRLEAGSGTDDFIFRIQIDGSGGCGDSFGEELVFRPDEQGINHDNWTPVHYMDLIPINCTGQMRFRISAQNTGDDEFEARDRSVAVTKY